jgi:hypothetical protein
MCQQTTLSVPDYYKIFLYFLACSAQKPRAKCVQSRKGAENEENCCSDAYVIDVGALHVHLDEYKA